jgi:hypothetical protein
MDKNELIKLILEQRQAMLNAGPKVTQGEIIALIAMYDALLAQLVEGKKVA